MEERQNLIKPDEKIRTQILRDREIVLNEINLCMYKALSNKKPSSVRLFTNVYILYMNIRPILETSIKSEEFIKYEDFFKNKKNINIDTLSKMFSKIDRLLYDKGITKIDNVNMM